MFGAAIAWADWLDTWLKAHVGRFYNAILGVGLVTSIGATITAINHGLGSTSAQDLKDLSGFAVTLVFQVGLLINQLAQLHHFREDRRARREEAKAARAERKGASKT